MRLFNIKDTLLSNKKFYYFLIPFIIILISNFLYPIKSLNFKRLTFLKPINPSRKLCPILQDNLDSLIASENDKWSITILDKNRNIISEVNAYKPLIPASNIKLITTAYAIEKLSENFLLKTRLVLREDGNFEIWGDGDPDLSELDLKDISTKATNIFNTSTTNNNDLTLILYEEPSANWWSSTWSPYDRSQSYGSPITRLAIRSNSPSRSNQYPLISFKSYLNNQIKSFGLNPNVITKEYKSQSFFFSNRKVITEIQSAPLNSLISLSNSESHNFTAEILLRHAAKSWNPEKASKKVYRWLIANRIPAREFVLIDGSGLSRENRATTVGIASLLWFMDNKQSANLYKSSMSVLGIRGTLRNFASNSQIQGNFYGKTGTLTGVRAISGLMDIKDGKRYISIISNNSDRPDVIIRRILELSEEFSQCF